MATTFQIALAGAGMAAGTFKGLIENTVADAGEALTLEALINLGAAEPLTDAQWATKLVSNTIGGAAAANDEQAFIDAIAELAQQFSRGDLMVAYINLLDAVSVDDPVWGAAIQQWNNRLAVSEALDAALATEANTNAGDVALLQGLMAGVTANPATLNAALADVADAWIGGVNPNPTPVDPVESGQTYRLTVGQDIFEGPSGSTEYDDLYVANVAQNPMGQQVNTLGSGDVIDGGKGDDTLSAKIAAGAFVGGSLSMPIQPETKSVETIKVQAVLADVNPDGNNDQVFLNAKDMVDVAYIGSEYSDADLTIMNLTSKGVAGGVDAMTVGMKYTGNKDSKWDASDLSVYFDQDYLVGESDAKSGFFYDLLDQEAFDESNGTAPLQGFPLNAVKFTIGGVNYTLEISTDEMAEISTHAELVELLNEKLAETYPALTGLEFEVLGTFSDTEGLRTSNRIQLTDNEAGSRTITNGSIGLNTESGAGNLYWNQGPVDKVTTEAPVSINVELEKVGLAGDGGELVIGSMNKTSGNEWGDVNTTTNTVSGIEEFNVTVIGDASKSSSLAGLHSTNNNLRIVNVESEVIPGRTSFADLTIGNSNTAMGGFNGYQNALKDVQIFNASAFQGDLTVFAALTDELTAKYFDLVDQAPNAPDADNVHFRYTGGTGDDVFNVTISANNGAFSGAATREDFDMSATIAGGSGNDTITLAIVGNGSNSGPDLQDVNGLAYASFGGWSTEETLANWYDNQRLTDSLRIDGGDGDDTIWTPGSGNVTIDAGAGNDTVYADNTAAKAVWVLNAASGADSVRLQLDNLQSGDNTGYDLHKAEVVVSFLGFEAEAKIASVNGRATDLDINQAIKLAINSDPVLSKLIKAEDGPGFTLVITSLIDGQMVLDDLSVAIVPPTVAELTQADAAQLTSWYGETTPLTAATAQARIEAAAERFNNNTDGVYNQNFALDGPAVLDGDNSLHTSDNTITGDLGNDVIVLGTGRLSNDTVVYEGFDNGTDTIVNFVAGETANLGLLNTADVTNFTDGTAEITVDPVAASFVLNVTGSVAAGAGTITFSDAVFGDGAGAGVDIVVNVTGGETAAEIAQLIEDAFDAYVGEQFTAVANGDTVEFTQVTEADFDLLTLTMGNVGGEDIDYNLSGVGLTIDEATLVDGVTGATIPETFATFTVTFGDADQAASYTFDGVTVDVLEGETAENIAAAFAAADGDFTNWEVDTYVPGATSVTFIASAAGSVAEVTDAAFVGANIVDVIDVLPAGRDMLDFIAYDVTGVAVGTMVGDTFTPDETFHGAWVEGDEYVFLVGNAENAGEYQMLHVEATGVNTYQTLGIIGTADFGQSMNFVEENFII